MLALTSILGWLLETLGGPTLEGLSKGIDTIRGARDIQWGRGRRGNIEQWCSRRVSSYFMGLVLLDDIKSTKNVLELLSYTREGAQSVDNVLRVGCVISHERIVHSYDIRRT